MDKTAIPALMPVGSRPWSTTAEYSYMVEHFKFGHWSAPDSMASDTLEEAKALLAKTRLAWPEHSDECWRIVKRTVIKDYTVVCIGS